MNILNTKFIFYCLAGVATIFFLSSISGILLPFILAAILAYLLDPVVDKLVKRGLNRTIATSIIVFILVALMAFATLMFTFLVADGVKEVNYIANHYNELLEKYVFPYIQPLLPADFTKEMLFNLVESKSEVITSQVTEWGKAIALSSLKLFDVISIFLLTPLAFFYLLKDWDRILEVAQTLIPEDEQNYIRIVIKRMDKKLASFLRGQFLVCILLGLFYGIGLSLVGLKLGFAIGFLTGILSFIPFVGMLVGVVVATVVALLQFPLTDIQPFVLLGVIFMLGQFLEGSVLSPKLVGDALGLHPLWIIFAVLAGGELGGFVGILIALPAAAIISVLVSEILAYYKNSSIYLKRINKELNSTKE